MGIMATRREPPTLPRGQAALREIFLAFLKLGLVSFGGPIAHLGYFYEEFVTRRKWLSEQAYADLVALCQFLPGPASSQVGMALGLHRGGLAGAGAAWLAFTLPSALALTAFAYGLAAHRAWADSGWIHGLKLAAVAIVAQAVWSMGRQFCPDRARATLALAVAFLVLAVPGGMVQVLAILSGAVIGWRYFPSARRESTTRMRVPVSRRLGVVLLTLFFILLGLSLVAANGGQGWMAAFSAFYRAGALVFGGGHVVLPLLHDSVVPTGWVSDADFLAGYGAAQAVPGPLFTFAAYLGAVMQGPLGGWTGALVALVAIFLPAFLLIVGVLPFWEPLRRQQAVAAAFNGVNAAVVGLLLAALYDPIWVSAVRGNVDFILAAAGFAALRLWNAPPVAVVVALAFGGALLTPA